MGPWDGVPNKSIGPFLQEQACFEFGGECVGNTVVVLCGVLW